MKLINQLHGKITRLNVKGTTWRDLDIATKFHIKFLCELIDERLPARTTESTVEADASIYCHCKGQRVIDADNCCTICGESIRTA